MFTEYTASSGENNIKNVQDGKYETAIVWLLMLIFAAAVQDNVLNYYSSCD